MTAAEQWAFFFRYLTDKTKRRKIIEILEQEEGIAMASEVLMATSRDEHERVRLMSELKADLDWQSKRGYAQQEVRQEERQAIAGNLKAMGDSFDKIARATGLSLDDIAKL
jgi:hypothetical protein